MGVYAGSESIRFGTYNIRNGRNGGMESVLIVMSQASMDLGIFKETKFTGGVYTHGSARYSVVAEDMPSRHCGRVAVFYHPSLQYAVENPAVWAQRRRLPDRDGGVAMVHHRMLLATMATSTTSYLPWC